MASDFPIVDRNRLISEASKLLLDYVRPSTWHVVPIGGDVDFGLDVLVHLEVEGGVRHVFFIQLKGTESPDVVEAGTQISFPLKRSTLNLYANTTSDVMLAVAVVALDETGKLDPAASKISWQWMSQELSRLRGSQHVLDVSAARTTHVHVPVEQLLHARLDVRAHLEGQLQIARAAASLEDILTRSMSLGAAAEQPIIARLADVALRRPDIISAWITSDGSEEVGALPSIAYEIRALLRAGNTAQADVALKKLMSQGFGPAPVQQAAYLSMRAKVLIQQGRRAEALVLFEEAYAINATVENQLPLAETRFLRAVDAQDYDGIRAVRDFLASVGSDDGLALRLRVHIALDEIDEAHNCLALIGEEKRLLPQVVLLTSQRLWREALSVVEDAERAAQLSASDMTSIQLVAARAAWCAATEAVVSFGSNDKLPLAGAVGTQIEPAREAWEMALKALEGLKEQNWPPNIELVSPVVCGVAGVLGQQSRALELLGEAGAHRPQYEGLQHDLELLAIGARESELALAANLRRHESNEVLARRTSLLFELSRYAECLDAALRIVRSSEALLESAPMAVATGYAAAHRIGRHIEADELQSALRLRPEWSEYAYFAEFARRSHARPDDADPLAALREGLKAHPESWLLLGNLFSNLDVNEPAAAAEAVELAEQLRGKALFSLQEVSRLVAAYTTLENWQDAAREAAVGLMRFKDDERLLSMGAVAEEMQGHTGVAWAMLDRALQGGTNRIAVVHNYMGLALRLGRIEAVRAAIDRLLALVSNRAERLELLRLSALVYVQQERPDEAIAAAKALGDLVDQADEREEGTYVNLVMAVTLTSPEIDEGFVQSYQQRVDAFCNTWPESPLFRRVALSDDGPASADDLHNLLDQVVGDSRGRMREFERRERQARNGELPVPFVVRPGLVLHYLGDAFSLWDVATRSRPEDLQFHLNMAGSEKFAKSPEASRDTPLLDLTALLVLDALDLFDRVFAVFRRVAIPSLTVGFISQHAHGVLARGVAMEKARTIMGRINRWLDRIDQPSVCRVGAESVISAMDLLRNYADLAGRHAWLTYCDDAITRAMIHGESAGARFFTTLDLLSELCDSDELHPREVAFALARLAEWNVAITVEDRYFIASLCDAIPEEFSGDASLRFDAFQAHRPFMTLSRAVWHPGKRGDALTTHIAGLLVSMLRSDASNLDSVAAVLASWHLRVRFLMPANGATWRLMCFPVALALQRLTTDRSVALVTVLQRAVALSIGERDMTVRVEGSVARELGAIVSAVTKSDPSVGDKILDKLMRAMPPGTVCGDHCLEGYREGVNSK